MITLRYVPIGSSPQRPQRACDLAKQIGVLSGEVLSACRELGIRAPSPSSVLDAEQIQAVRRRIRERNEADQVGAGYPPRPGAPSAPEVAARSYGNPFAARDDGGEARPAPRRQRRPPVPHAATRLNAPVRGPWRERLSDLARVILEKQILPRVMGGYRLNPSLENVTPEQWMIDRAQEASSQWASEFFEPHEVAEWLTVHPDLTPDTAARLRSGGLTPRESALKLWHGKIVQDDHRTIAQLVMTGDLDAKEARRQLDALASP